MWAWRSDVLAGLLMTGQFPRCADDNVAVTSGTRARAETATVCLVNKIRRSYGRRALKPSPLGAAARRHVADMVAFGYFSHVSSDGRSLGDRIRATGHLSGAMRWMVGENLAWGNDALSTPRSVMQAWVTSPRHCRIVLRRRFRDANLAIAAGAPVQISAAAAGTYAYEFGFREQPRRTSVLTSSGALTGSSRTNRLSLEPPTAGDPRLGRSSGAGEDGAPGCR